MAKKVRKVDVSKVQNYKEDIDTLLVFAGLFSAVMTAFIIESYKTLQQDPSLQALMQIASQTSSYTLSAVFFNSTTIQTTAPSPPFQPQPVDVHINALWFASLIFSLITASLAMLVKQWLREYLAGDFTSGQAQLRTRHFRIPGVERWKVFEIAATLPHLLQLSLALFFAGLCLFTSSIHPTLAKTSIPIVSGWALFIILTTLAPAFFPRCPYKTALLRGLMKRLRQYLYPISQLIQACISSAGTHIQDRMYGTGYDVLVLLGLSREKNVRSFLYTTARSVFIVAVPAVLSPKGEEGPQTGGEEGPQTGGEEEPQTGTGEVQPGPAGTRSLTFEHYEAKRLKAKQLKQTMKAPLSPFRSLGMFVLKWKADHSPDFFEEDEAARRWNSDLDVLAAVDATQADDELFSTLIRESVRQIYPKPTADATIDFILKAIGNRLDRGGDDVRALLPLDLSNLTEQAWRAVTGMAAELLEGEIGSQPSVAGELTGTSSGSSSVEPTGTDSGSSPVEPIVTGSGSSSVEPTGTDSGSSPTVGSTGTGSGSQVPLTWKPWMSTALLILMSRPLRSNALGDEDSLKIIPSCIKRNFRDVYVALTARNDHKIRIPYMASWGLEDDEDSEDSGFLFDGFTVRKVEGILDSIHIHHVLEHQSPLEAYNLLNATILNWFYPTPHATASVFKLLVQSNMKALSMESVRLLANIVIGLLERIDKNDATQNSTNPKPWMIEAMQTLLITAAMIIHPQQSRHANGFSSQQATTSLAVAQTEDIGTLKETDAYKTIQKICDLATCPSLKLVRATLDFFTQQSVQEDYTPNDRTISLISAISVSISRDGLENLIKELKETVRLRVEYHKDKPVDSRVRVAERAQLLGLCRLAIRLVPRALKYGTDARDWQELFSYVIGLVKQHITARERDEQEWRPRYVMEWLPRRERDQWQILAELCLQDIEGLERETFKLFQDTRTWATTHPHQQIKIRKKHRDRYDSYFGDDFIKALSELSPNTQTARTKLLKNPPSTQTGAELPNPENHSGGVEGIHSESSGSATETKRELNLAGDTQGQKAANGDEIEEHIE
ncbi:hypothetical protein PHLCEN_2v2098 [Hermanssonia centrifuga]|uniref:DUF6535 domain-containing protein n=1 Tax=Hermanssonia centrifuga TaxID=98765 RepID=A0A2R6RQ43_9APHY|nr:hypothetical protein PHLCEN_2v2098 [Hermanssonia centrifuga]